MDFRIEVKRLKSENDKLRLDKSKLEKEIKKLKIENRKLRFMFKSI